MKNNKILQALTFLIKKPAVILIPLIFFFAGWWFALPSKKEAPEGTSTSRSRRGLDLLHAPPNPPTQPRPMPDLQHGPHPAPS